MCNWLCNSHFYVIMLLGHRVGGNMTRRQARDHLFIMLFRKEFHERDELNKQVDFYLELMEDILEEKQITKESKELLTKEDCNELKVRFNNIVEKLPEIDAILTELSAGWKLNRMGKVDLTVMRIAIFEIKFDEEIPNAVAINEAVEIAKKYGEESSGSFVNGVLAKMLR